MAGATAQGDDEAWKPVVGWEDTYEVSSLGRLRSLDRVLNGRAGSQRLHRGKVLKPKRSEFGHESYCLTAGDSPSWRTIHSLVLEAFVGPRPDGAFGCHNDGAPSNNRAANLRWDTPTNNSLDAVKHGTQRSMKGPRQFEYEFELLDGEEWRPMVGYEGLYEVSSLGRVKILDRIVGGNGGSRFLRRGHLKKLSSNRSGYQHVHVAKDGQKRRPGVHILVLETFVGPRPEGNVGCHNDGDPFNNRLENLRWDTRANNGLDTVKHGTHPMAGKTHCIHGHEYTPENTIWMRSSRNKTGAPWRQCRACQAASVLKRRPLSSNGHMRDRTHCPRGHEYTPGNTIVDVSDRKRSRSCRTCRNDRKRQKTAARREAIPARPCEQCGKLMEVKRSDARTCGHACRAAARRSRLARDTN